MKNRYFQFIRGILIFLVVFIHCMYENNAVSVNCINIGIRCIINFCVPTFIFLSGYFVNKEKVQKSPKEYIIYRFKRLIIPLVIFSFLYTIIEFLTGNISCKKSILKFISFKSAPHLYYVVALFQLVLLTPLILELLERKSTKILLYLITPIYLIILGITRIFFNIEIPLYQYWFFGWIIYYLLGIEHEKIKVNYLWTLVTVIFSIILNVFIYMNNHSCYSYATSQLNICNMIYVLTIIPIILDKNSKYITAKISSLIENIGDNSFGIYFIHMLVLNVLRIFVKSYYFNFIVYYAVMSLSTLLISYILIKLFKKITKSKFDEYLGF